MGIRNLLLLVPLLPGPALAQVTTNDQALDALKPAAPATAPAAPAKVKPSPPRHVVRHTPAAHAIARPAPPQVPLAPPANPVIAPPPPALPQRPRETPVPVPVKPDAVGTVAKIEGGARITFGAGTADLNDATHSLLLLVAGQAKQDKQIEITLTAWAPGTPEDPSTPRRLALDRALAARAVLISAGVESERIHAVAKGFTDIGTAPPDRLDIAAVHPKTTPAAMPAPVTAPAKAAAPR